MSDTRRGEWSSGLSVVIRIGRFLVQTPLGTRPGLGTQPRYKIPCDIRIENVKTVINTVFSHFQSECHRESCSEVGPPRLWPKVARGAAK